MRQRPYLLACLGLLGLVLFNLACDSADNPVAPSGSVLTVTASPTRIGLRNEASTITVVGFKPDGNPLNPGTQIQLTTTLGVLAETLVEATSGGRATTTLTGDGTPGTATITASLPGGGGGEGGGASATVDVQIGETAETRPGLTINASPSRINIEQESTISVITRNPDGTILGGERVTLMTTLGTLDEENLVTDSNGEASTRLRPDGRSGMADVTASLESSPGGGGGEGAASNTVSVTILRTVVTVQVNPSILDVNDPDTTTPRLAEVTVLARDEDNIPLVEGHQVRLTATLGTLNPESVRTDPSGVATSQYRPGNRAGTDTITAFLGNSDPATATVTIRDAPATVTLDLDRTQFTPSSDGTDFLATVRVSNANGEPLVNEIVRFTVVGEDTGNEIAVTIDPAGGPSTDATGRAQATLTITAEAVSDEPSGSNLIFQALVRDVPSNEVRVEIVRN